MKSCTWEHKGRDGPKHTTPERYPHEAPVLSRQPLPRRPGAPSTTGSPHSPFRPMRGSNTTARDTSRAPAIAAPDPRSATDARRSWAHLRDTAPRTVGRHRATAYSPHTTPLQRSGLPHFYTTRRRTITQTLRPVLPDLVVVPTIAHATRRAPRALRRLAVAAPLRAPALLIVETMT